MLRWIQPSTKNSSLFELTRDNGTSSLVMQLAFSGISSLIEGGAVIVAASPLLASAATQQFAAGQLSAGVAVWQRPPILTLDRWLTSLWQEERFSTLNVPALLSPQQEHQLWKQAIEATTAELFDSDATARLARRANATLAQWQIPAEHEAWREHVDGEQFLRWRKAVRLRCGEEGWMLRADLWAAALQWALPDRVAFLGFTSVPPALAAIQASIPEVTIFGSAEEEPPERAAVTQCESFAHEIERAARWARQRWEQSPESRIAVFVPDLDEHRTEVERLFTGVFYPRSSLRFRGMPSHESMFHVQAAAPLVSHPLVVAALLVLELGKGRIDQACAAALLRSPFLRGAIEERDARAEADLKLRRQRELDVSLREIRFAAERCPILARRLEQVQTLVRGMPQALDLPGWGQFFADLLQRAGWPGDLELSIDEQEITEAWKEVASNLGALGLVRRSVGYAEALRELRQLLAAAPGVERGGAFSPVQILDASEAEGLRCDAAFVVGLSEDIWPPVVQSSPLIPLRLQRAYQVTGSGPQSSHAERMRTTRALFMAAPEVQATYSGHIAPIVRPFVSLMQSEPGWSGTLALDAFERVACELVEDTDAPPFVVDGEVRGGTSLLKAQSLCPFKAFAEHRLRARTPEEACFGFDALDRGTFVHAALQLVWQELKSAARLRLMPPTDLRGIIRRSVEAAVTHRDDGAFFEQAQRAERERLEELIFDWLTTVEKDRLLDFTVENVETEIQFALAGLPLRLRIDRIDRLNDGRLVLIDYKSGKQSKTKLDCPRPREPQLLVYAAAQATAVDGVFFGQLKPRDQRLVGMSRARHASGQSTKVLKDEWDTVMSNSRAAVEQLATDFRDGKAAVHPLPGACEYCAMKPLCRIKERASTEDDCE